MDFESLLRSYFAGEKGEAFWILAAGLLSLGVALALWIFARDSFARGLAYALLLVAALGISVGGTVYFRSDAQATALVQLRAADPARFVAEEGPRMQKVVAGFSQYRFGYAVAIVLAMLLAFTLGRPGQQGFAVGLLLLAALGLTIDYYAEARADRYLRGMREVGALPVPEPAQTGIST